MTMTSTAISLIECLSEKKLWDKTPPRTMPAYVVGRELVFDDYLYD